MNQSGLAVFSVLIYVMTMLLLIALVILKYRWLKRLIVGFAVGLLIAVVSLGIKMYVERGIDHGVIIAKIVWCGMVQGKNMKRNMKFTKGRNVSLNK